MVGKTLVTGGVNVPVRFLNPSAECQTLYAGTTIGQLSTVKQVETITCSKGRQPKFLPSHLKDLYERSIKYLTYTEAKQVYKLLTEYSTLFAESDMDLGRTNIIKHKIDTGDAKPVKHPLRRTPAKMSSEIDKHLDDMLRRDVIQPSSSPWSSGVVLV